MSALDNRCQKRGLKTPYRTNFIVYVLFFFQHIDMNSYFKQRVKRIKIVSDSNDYMPAGVKQKKKYKINKAACWRSLKVEHYSLVGTEWHN